MTGSGPRWGRKGRLCGSRGGRSGLQVAVRLHGRPDPAVVDLVLPAVRGMVGMDPHASLVVGGVVAVHRATKLREVRGCPVSEPYGAQKTFAAVAL